MKTTIEVSGYEIKIEEMEGKIMVSALQDGEVVEEFELESEMGDDFDDDDKMQDDEEMSAFGSEEDDDDMEDEEGGMEEEEDFGSDEEGKTLESFAHFVKNRKK